MVFIDKDGKGLKDCEVFKVGLEFFVEVLNVVLQYRDGEVKEDGVYDIWSPRWSVRGGWYFSQSTRWRGWRRSRVEG